jgi:hypothetical protein
MKGNSLYHMNEFREAIKCFDRSISNWYFADTCELKIEKIRKLLLVIFRFLY